MIFIAHRGNLNGPCPEKENHPTYLEQSINAGYHVEIDLRYENDTFCLGHDYAQYEIEFSWLLTHYKRLWIHCKDLNVINLLEPDVFNYFWHENDTITLTSKRYIWAYPGKQSIKNSIAVLPELHNDSFVGCIGVCTDYLYVYRNIYKYGFITGCNNG